jgi:hypothetical protein
MFGFRETILTKVIRLVTGGRFVAYLVAYVRDDAIDSFTAAPQVPFSICPHLSQSFAARISHSKDMTLATISGSGIAVEWDDPTRQVADLLEVGDNENVYIAPPGIHHFFGPIPKDEVASHWAMAGFRMNVIALPEVEDPIFFVVNQELRGVFNKKEMVSRFASDYEFRVEGLPVSDFQSVAVGAVVFGVPLKSVSLQIGNKTIDLKPNASYEEVQTIVSAQSPSHVLFYGANDSALMPREFPTALQLSQMSPLKVKMLEDPATVRSLDLFTSLQIELHDLLHQTITKNGLWFPKDGTVNDLTKKLPSWFDMKRDDSLTYVVSPLRRYSGQIWRILPGDSLLTEANLRVDVLKLAHASSCQEIARLFQEGGPMATSIEVQTLEEQEKSLWPKVTTIGFYPITKNTNANMLAKSIGKATQAKILIRGTKEWNCVAIKGKDRLYELFQQLAETSNWTNDRPILAFRLATKRPESTT